MTPVFCCGFECGVASAHWTLLASASFNTGTVRSGARSLRINPTAASTGQATSIALTSSAIWVARFYVFFTTLPSANCTLLTMGQSGQVRFQQSDSKIYALSAITQGATGITVTTGQWYRIDASFDGSSGKVTDVQVDGVACGTATTGSPVSGTQLVLGTAASMTADYYIDDLVVTNTLADYPIGAGNVYNFVPTSDGTHNVAGASDFQRTLTGTDITNATTTAYQLVDNIPLDTGTAASVGTFVNMIAPPNATDYVECIFGPAPGISTPTVAPRAVEVVAAIAQAGTGTGNMIIRLNDNGTVATVYTATTVAGVTSYAYKRAHFAIAPTGGAWTVVSGDGNFNNLRVRYGSPAAVDANPDQYFAATMVEAEFEPLVVLERSKITSVGHPFIF